MLAVTRLHQIAHNRNLVLRHGPNLHQIKTLHGILAHKLLLGIETYILSHQSCWRSYRPGVSRKLTPGLSVLRTKVFRSLIACKTFYRQTCAKTSPILLFWPCSITASHSKTVSQSGPLMKLSNIMSKFF